MTSTQLLVGAIRDLELYMFKTDRSPIVGLVASSVTRPLRSPGGNHELAPASLLCAHSFGQAAQGLSKGMLMAARDDAQLGSWLTLSEAAARSGLHKELLRARAKRGQLEARRNNRGEVLVMLPASLLMPAQGDGQDAAQGTVYAQVEQLAELVTSLEGELANVRLELVEARAEARTAKAVALADVEAAKRAAEEAIAAKESLVEELKALLAEMRKPWWRWLIG